MKTLILTSEQKQELQKLLRASGRTEELWLRELLAQLEASNRASERRLREEKIDYVSNPDDTSEQSVTQEQRTSKHENSTDKPLPNNPSLPSNSDAIPRYTSEDLSPAMKKLFGIIPDLQDGELNLVKSV